MRLPALSDCLDSPLRSRACHFLGDFRALDFRQLSASTFVISDRVSA
jgi:hypothetical protein